MEKAFAIVRVLRKCTEEIWWRQSVGYALGIGRVSLGKPTRKIFLLTKYFRKAERRFK